MTKCKCDGWVILWFYGEIPIKNVDTLQTVDCCNNKNVTDAKLRIFVFTGYSILWVIGGGLSISNQNIIYDESMYTRWNGRNSIHRQALRRDEYYQQEIRQLF